MSASGVNVLRYTALLLGAAYGLTHQSSLLAQQKLASLDRDYARQESLIRKAKAEYVRKTLPEEKKTEGGGVISDPNDSKFDLEAWLTMKMAEGPK
ncbi:hypothetical protein MMC12_007493 [Toensbergia leucococca]|nr:hypothetical protein [Toensbergia leucococca]